MAIYLNTRSRKDLIIHLMLVVGIILSLFLSFFFVYLPWSTNHGQSITVPDLRKANLEDVKATLSERKLDYIVSDCTFVPGVPPFTVLSQYPFPNSLVKEGRNIYLTVTMATAPMIRMPDLVSTNMGLRSALSLLRSVGLQEGNIRYIPDIAENAVLEQWYQGKKIEPGTQVPKGSKIELVVGNGIGNTELDVPNLIGVSLEEAEIIIKGSDLRMGTILYKQVPGAAPGTVVEQRPAPGIGTKINVGEIIDLWIAGKPDTDTGEGPTEPERN
ncbi:penicillin-binding protein [Siphonobacter sp. BAB-5385]|uniref:PASTA domain-containing protein n=1 Tax=Siphonobacter curvatus TaxID=2094562 RepID=A0A2S7IRV6_9BACT|nr:MULTISPECIES: PASTA domain-containing protein [Siphonobacter]OZI08956.1 penicillin-binding protein [Siphonobacter sp. BAB-5385]PMD96598.1 penicillin-binding protein [Siphonobacter sp. BAB-5405]PQA60447.1 PASTA domain-containing protein [Siphonobacter curvatus]